MSNFAVGMAALIAAVVAVVAAEPPAPDASPERIASLVRQLGSPRYPERETATEALNTIGEAATPALQLAVRSPDAETRRRASELLDRIQQRTTVAKLLQPTVVSLKFNNTPIEDAVKSLAASSGLRIELARGQPWAGRRVSVDSGPLPVWEAIDLFCRKADLHEWDGLKPLPSSVETPSVLPQPNVVFGGVQAQVFVNGRLTRTGDASEPKVVLLNGPSPTAASHDAGAVRLRLLPPGTPFPAAAVGDEVLLPLQVSAETRLRWAGVFGVRIDRAIDEHGVDRLVTGIVAPTSNVDEMTWMMMPNGAMMALPAIGRAGMAALKVARADRSQKTMKEIAGELTARVAITEALARLEGPLKSGQSIEASSGVTLKLTDLSAPADGELRLSIDLQSPAEVQPVGALAVGMNNRVVFQGGMVVQQQIVAGGKQATIPTLPAGTTEYNGFALEDDHGGRWAAIRGAQESMQMNMQGLTAKLIVVFKAPSEGAAAARLVFRGSRPTTIAVPFRFRDVPLQ